MEKAFCIVEFIDGIQLVPRKWLNGNKRLCKWPEGMTAKQYSKAVSNRQEAEDFWESFPVIRILGEAETYKRGLAKLKMAENESDLNTTDQESSKKVIDLGMDVSSEEETQIPAFPDANKFLALEQSSELSFSDDHSQDLLNCDNRKRKLQKVKNKAPAKDSPVQSTAKDNLKQLEQSSAFQTQILRTVTKLNFKLDIILENQDLLMKKFEGQKSYENDDENTLCLPDLPLKSYEELKVMERQLASSQQFRKALVNKLKKIGGTVLNNVTVRLMSHIFCPAVGNEFSYHGRNGKNSFLGLALNEIIKDVIRIHIPNATDFDISKPVKTWLRHCKEKMQKVAIV